MGAGYNACDELVSSLERGVVKISIPLKSEMCGGLMHRCARTLALNYTLLFSWVFLILFAYLITCAVDFG